MNHGLSHDDADVVAAVADGWYFERLLDGRVRISKYRIEEPSAGEQPLAQVIIEASDWNSLVAAIGFGESPEPAPSEAPPLAAETAPVRESER